MSRRDAIVRATAGALQPKALDLTKYRQRSVSQGRPIHVASEIAAGALGFAHSELASILLRIKYAWQRNRTSFGKAHLLFLDRHGFDAKRPSLVLYAIAMVAIFEWAHDHCSECRFKKKPGKGMQCAKCGNSGRKPFPLSQRLWIVNDFIASAGGARLTMKTFKAHWLKQYGVLLDDLRDVDYYIAEGIDLKFQPNQNRSTVPEPREIVADQAEDERGAEAPATSPE